MDKTKKYYAQWKKSDTEEHILLDSICVKVQEGKSTQEGDMSRLDRDEKRQWCKWAQEFFGVMEML